MLRLNQYENRLAARLVESYQRHSTMKISDDRLAARLVESCQRHNTMKISDEIEHIRQQAVDLDMQQFWLLTQER